MFDKMHKNYIYEESPHFGSRNLPKQHLMHTKHSDLEMNLL